MKKKTTLLLLLIASSMLFSQSSRYNHGDSGLSTAISHVDADRDGTISLEEARPMFEKYIKTNSRTASHSMVLRAETTLVDLITYFEGVDCSSIKGSAATRRFIEIYYTNRFFDRKDIPFGITATGNDNEEGNNTK